MSTDFLSDKKCLEVDNGDVAPHCICPKCYCGVHNKMAKTENIRLHVFCHNLKKQIKKPVKR
jgi:hypothetical protein